MKKVRIEKWILWPHVQEPETTTHDFIISDLLLINVGKRNLAAIVKS